MKISHVLPGLLAVVLAVGAVFASESTALEQGYKYSLSEPCEQVRTCNNVPDAPICKSIEGDTMYKKENSQCKVVLRHL